MHPQGRVVGNRIYYGSHNGSPCSAQSRPKCLLILFSVLLILIGFIITIIGFTLKPFWDENDDWCSFCKEDRLQTERDTANCRIAGPIILSLGVLLTVFTCCYVKFKKNTAQNNSTNATTTTPGNITVQYNQPSISYSNTASTVIHPPPTSTSSYTPSAPAMTTQQYSTTHPQQFPIQSPYPPPPNPVVPYLPSENPMAPHPPQQSPYSISSEPMMPPPPSYNDVTGYDQKS